MSKIKTSMANWKRPIHMLLVAALLVAVFAVSLSAAPATQVTRTEEVAGVLTGGQFAKIWLGLEAQTPAEDVQLVATWDRNNPTGNATGFYVLTESQTRAVLSGASLQNNNLTTGARLSNQSPENEIGAVFGGNAGPYTIVLYNDSATDAAFTLRVTNGVLIDDSNQVRDTLAAPTAEDGDEAATDDDAAADEPAPAPEAPAPTPAPVTATTPVTETAETETTTETTATVVAETPAVVTTTTGEVRAEVMEGALPEQFDRHYLAFESYGSNVPVRLVLAFDPQDQTELARSINFWVFDDAGFRRYIDPGTTTAPGSFALSAGNTSNSFRANERVAEFTTLGSGNYTIVVYNNSAIPATYSLRVEEGGILIDDSQQTLTAQQGGIATTESITTTTETGEVVTTTVPAQQPAAATTTQTTAGRTGTPGGTYVVRAGDTLSLIARDVLGNTGAWRDICSLNQIADCNRIEVGDELQLPTIAQIGTIQAPATTPATTASATTATTPTATTPATTAPATTTTDADADDEDADEADADEADDADDADADDDADDVASSDSNDLIAALEASGSFGTLIQALEAANLTDALETGGPFTVFAPTDAAFADLPAGALDQLLANPTGQLTQILLFHVLPGRVGADDVSDGMSATTQQGKPVRFELDGSDVKVNGAGVVVPDITASNGVIHAIDAVILPPPD